LEETTTHVHKRLGHKNNSDFVGRATLVAQNTKSGKKSRQGIQEGSFGLKCADEQRRAAPKRNLQKVIEDKSG